jgi:hypothetical protein
MLGAVVNCGTAFDAFLPSIAPLFVSDNDVVRAAAFKIVSNRRALAFDRGLLDVAFAACANPSQSPVVAYYAALVVALFLQEGPDVDLVREAVGSHFESIYAAINSLVVAFEEDRLFDALTAVAEFFHAEIMPHIVSVFEATAGRLIQAACECDESVYAMNDQSLLKLVGLIAAHPDGAGPVFEAIFPIAAAAVSELARRGLRADDVVEVIAGIIAFTPAFNPEFWSVVPLLESIEDIDFDTLAPVLEQLIWRDADLARRPDVVAHLSEVVAANIEDDFAAAEGVAVALLMRMGAELPLIPALIEFVASAAENVSDLFSALLIVAGASAVRAGSAVEVWAEKGQFPLFVAAVVNCFDLFAGEPALQEQLVAAAYSAIRSEAHEPGEEREDANDDLALDQYTIAPSAITTARVPTPRWFDTGKLLVQFGAFLQRIAQSGSSAVQALVEAEGVELGAILEQLHLFAQRTEPQ